MTNSHLRSVRLKLAPARRLPFRRTVSVQHPRARTAESPSLGRAPVPSLLDAFLSGGRALDVLDGRRALPAASHEDRDPDHEDDDPHDEQNPTRSVDVEPVRVHGDRERHDRADDAEHDAEEDESGSVPLFMAPGYSRAAGHSTALA